MPYDYDDVWGLVDVIKLIIGSILLGGFAALVVLSFAGVI